MNTPSTAGFVYLIRSDSGHYKIGKAVDPNRRATQFTLQLPFKTSVVYAIPCDNHHDAERFLHRAFNQFHVNGEWFTLTPIATLYFEYLAHMVSSSEGGWYRDAFCHWPQQTFDALTDLDLKDPRRIKGWMHVLLHHNHMDGVDMGADREDGPTGF